MKWKKRRSSLIVTKMTCPKCGHKKAWLKGNKLICTACKYEYELKEDDNIQRSETITENERQDKNTNTDKDN